MSIGEKIKTIRSEKGITQRELAERLFTTQQNLAQYENNKRKPKIDTLRRIADALEVPISELMGWDYYNGADGAGPNELEKFRNSSYFHDVENYQITTNGYYKMMVGIFDSVKEVDYNDTTFVVLTLNGETFVVTYDFFYDLQENIEKQIKMIIKEVSLSKNEIKKILSTID